jgi:uncharacterized membrane protein YccC
MTVASLASFVFCRLLGLSQSYPAVLTAVIVMQGSVGASLKAMIDRLVGSLGGAAWGVAVLMVLRPSDGLSLGIAFTVALVPLALLAALNPAYRAAPVTAVILLLTPTNSVSPIAQAVQRVLEIGLGGIVAMAVALFVLPSRAREALAEAASRAIRKMGELASLVLSEPFNPDAIQALHDDIRLALSQAEAAGAEAARERSTYLTFGPDPQPILRTLRRIRNDLSAIGRTTAEPLPESLRAHLAEPASNTAAAVSAFLRASAEAIASHQPSASLQPVDEAFARYADAVAKSRKAGLTHELADETVARAFGLAFVLEQLHQDLKDLADRTTELSQTRR